jgi:hypothetical protein
MDSNQVLLDENIFDALMKITPTNELEKILEESGLKILERWSDYSFGNSDKTKKIIYCLKAYEN